MLDRLQIVQSPLRLFRSVMQFGKSNAGDAKLLGEAIEPLAQLRRVILDHIDADSGVQHVLEHQRLSRLSLSGCARSRMKSSDARGPCSNRSSQRFPCGVMSRPEPILTTSTSCTSSGKATAFGSRTAWLRLLVNTVERVMPCLPLYIPTGYTQKCKDYKTTIKGCFYPFSTSTRVLPSLAGEGETLIPAASMAAILDSASPLPPAMMAPACPIRRPGGAVRPAMKPTIGFLRPRLASSLRNCAASSPAEPPISPIMMIDSVALSASSSSSTSMNSVPFTVSPPIPTAVVCPSPSRVVWNTAS